MRLPLVITCIAFYASLHHSNAQKFLDRRLKEYTVQEGGTLKMNCYVQDINEGDPIVWKKNKEAIFVDEDKLTDDDRLQVVRNDGNSTLTINKVEPIDMAEYSCAITDPEDEVFYKVAVQTKPAVVLTPDLDNYQVKMGDTNVVIRCIAKGNPTPTVAWKRTDGPIPADVTVSEHRLVFSRISIAHMGTYICEGSNSAGKDSEQINLVVNEPTDNGTPEKAPWIKTDLPFIPIKVGANINLSCAYDGLPIPQAEWFFNGYKINMNEKRFQHTAQYAKRDSSNSVTILKIEDISEDAFGDYMCRASNSLGMSQATIHVSGRPGPPAIELDNSDLTWKVQSYEPIDEYRVYYRPISQDEWNKYETVRTSKSDNDGSDWWEHSISLIPYLEPGTKYALQVKAKNNLGYGSFAKDYVTIEIPNNVKETASSTSRTFAISSIFVAIFILLLG